MLLNQGYLCGCGLRGGYFEIIGIPADVKAELYKVMIISIIIAITIIITTYHHHHQYH
jgi:hypothetical protein